MQQDRGDGAGFVAVPDGTTLAVGLSDPTKLVEQHLRHRHDGRWHLHRHGDLDRCRRGDGDARCDHRVAADWRPEQRTRPSDRATGNSPRTRHRRAATKTWVKFRLGTSPSATNLAGLAHTFTVTAEFSVAPGVFQPLTSGLVDFTWSGGGTVAAPPSTTCPILGAAGTCTVTVNDPNPGVGTLTLNGLSSATVTVGGTPTTFTNVNPTTTPNAIEFTSQTATKTWIAYFVTITPSANNPVGTQHDFVISGDGQRRKRGSCPGGGRVDRVHLDRGRVAGDAESVCHKCGGDMHGECDVSVGGHGHVDGDELDRQRRAGGRSDRRGLAGFVAGPAGAVDGVEDVVAVPGVAQPERDEPGGGAAHVHGDGAADRCGEPDRGRLVGSADRNDVDRVDHRRRARSIRHRRV